MSAEAPARLARPAGRRPPGEDRRRARAAAGYTAGIVLGALVWQLVGVHSSSETFVSLTATLHRLGQLIADGTLPDALRVSLACYAVGMVISLALGAFLGLLLARRRLLRVAFEPWVIAIYATPMVGVIPFLLALLGFGFWPKVIVIVLFAFFPVLLNTQRGAMSISAELLDVTRVYRTRERDVWRHVIVPFTLPFMMTGVRQALARGLVGMIAGDFFLSSDGLGSLLITASERFDTAEVLAITLVITVIGLALMAIGRALENYFAKWRVGR